MRLKNRKTFGLRRPVGFFPSRILWTIGVAVLVISFSSSVLRGADSFPEKIQFNRDIRPILSDNCYACHGPDESNRKAKLRLDVREIALKKEAFMPGKPDESELVRRVYTTDPDDQMPPPDTRHRLTEAEKGKLKRWIAEGAEYQQHWAYISPVRPNIPAVKNSKWTKNPIDNFILRELEAKKLPPSAEADKATLLRRLSLDLIGLPPTPDEVAAFVADDRPGAYESAVDRLFASPHFGERMAVPWLDLARFADTVGYHGDQNINVFPYRDYVIKAFNENKPFDQFTTEQLAGDLLPGSSPEQKVASGFNRLNMVTREGGAQAGEYLAKYGADRVRTVSTTFLGSTMGCSECHDHKFDPFSTKDFYSMKAFFADVQQWGVYADYGYTPNPDLKGFNNDYPFPPEITVESPYLLQRLKMIDGQIGELEKRFLAKWTADPKQRSHFDDWRKQSVNFLEQNPDGWMTLVPTNGTDEKSKTATFTTNPDGSIMFSGDGAENAEFVFPLAAGGIAAIRLELLPSDKHEGKILRDKSDSTEIRLSAELKSPSQKSGKGLSFYHADANHNEERYSGGSAIIGVASGWRTAKGFSTEPHTAVYLLNEPIQTTDADELRIKLGKNSAASVRISITPFANRKPLHSGADEALARDLRSDSSPPSARVNEVYLLSANSTSDSFSDYKKVYREELAFRDGKAQSVVTASWTPVETRVLPRGNWLSTDGEVVQPAVPHFMSQVRGVEGRQQTRLDLARWIVAKDNPLTARTFVNRTWKQFFGTAISSVVDDLGSQGEWPTHPELLDWMAVEFMESGWDVKHIIKLMVMSRTYRQSSNPRPEIHERDPANRLLASQSPRRLEAEFIRDNALAISGLLNPDIGGPSVYPYQPAGYYSNIQFPDRDYHPSLDGRQYRRGLYSHWQRTFLQPMLANFDAPGREECIASRNVSNSPQQALTLLNDPTFVEAARVLAGVVVAEPSDSQRLEKLYRLALARSAKSQEAMSMEKFLKVQRDYYNANPEEADKLLKVGLAPESKNASAPELAAWTQVCRVVLSLHETITRY